MAGSVEEVISTLYEMVQDAWSVPLSSDKCVLEREKVLDLLDEINNQLPGEFKQAKTIVDARNEIIANAKKEADSILKQADLKAEQIISEQELLVRAKNEARNIMADAQEQADALAKANTERLQALKKASIQFVMDALVQSETAISSALADVSDTKNRLFSMIEAKPEDSLAEQVSDEEDRG